jgi:hypothetical protein
MKQLAALAWKEWHEVRIYLWISLGVFIGLPVVGGVEAMYQHVGRNFAISVSPWGLRAGISADDWKISGAPGRSMLDAGCS